MNTDTNDNTVLEGEVIFFHAPKGFGFISRKDGGKDLFVHFSSLVMDGYKVVKQGQKVCFTVGTGPQGIQAENVKVIK